MRWPRRDAGEGAERRPARGDGGRPEGRRDGRGRRQARRRLPGHRRPAEGLRRAARAGHPAGRVAASSAPPSGSRCAGSGRCARSSSTGSSSPASTRSPRSWRSCTTARRGGCGCRSSCGSRSAAGSARWSTTARAPESLFAHIPGLKVVACSNAVGRLLDAPAGHRLRRPGDLLRAEAAVLGEGRRSTDATRRRCTPPGCCGRGTTAVLACYGPMVRTCLDAAAAAEADGHDLEVIDLRTLSPLRPRPGGRLGAAHRPAGGGGRGAVVGVGGVRGRGPRAGGVLPLAGGAGAAGDRVRHALPAVAGARTTTCPTWTGCSTPSTGRWRGDGDAAGVRHAGRRRGADRGRDRRLAGGAGRHRGGQPGAGGGRDGEGGGRAAVAVRGHGGGAAGGAGATGAGGHADHRDRRRPSAGTRCGPARGDAAAAAGAWRDDRRGGPGRPDRDAGRLRPAPGSRARRPRRAAVAPPTRIRRQPRPPLPRPTPLRAAAAAPTVPLAKPPVRKLAPRPRRSTCTPSPAPAPAG